MQPEQMMAAIREYQKATILKKAANKLSKTTTASAPRVNTLYTELLENLDQITNDLEQCWHDTEYETTQEFNHFIRQVDELEKGEDAYTGCTSEEETEPEENGEESDNQEPTVLHSCPLTWVEATTSEDEGEESDSKNGQIHPRSC
jgi:hypothetical protein